MKTKILALFITTLAFSQSGLVNPKDVVSPSKNTGSDLIEHFTNVYKMSVSLNDVDQQITALINIFVISQKDETLLGLSELYLNKKNYRSALMCANSVKDSTTIQAKNLKGWIYKLGGEIKLSNKYFEQLLNSDKEKINQNAFQLAVNNFEIGNIVDARKIISNYKSKTKTDEMVTTTDRVSFYSAKLTAAWENLEGLILISENGDIAKLKANKNKIIAYFDKSIALDANFAMPKDNKNSFIKLLEDK